MIMTPRLNVVELKTEIEPQINRIAALHGLNPQIIKAIITQESSWNPYAIRYEQGYRYFYFPARYATNQVSLDTETFTQKMSFGLTQVMGALAREQGFTGVFLTELLDIETNLTQCAIRLAALSRRSKDIEAVIAGYNGGFGTMSKRSDGRYLNQSYVTSVTSIMKRI